MMFRDCIKGLDKVIQSEVKPGKTILVTGPPGSLKSSFVHLLLKNYVEKSNEFGLYATLEQDVSSHLESLESIGIGLSYNLQITDYTEILSDEFSTEINYLEFTEMMLKHLNDRFGDRFTTLGFDSLGALYSMLPEVKNPRKFAFNFFNMLKKYNLTTFVIFERSLGGEWVSMGNEGFLADAIFLLGLKKSGGRTVRFFQIEKMRSVKHSMDPHAVNVGPNGLEILGPLFDSE